MSLYRKHRPQQFMDLVGQDHVKVTLSNALSSGNFAHAYLFSGPKGSGKTTTARLLAKALNCKGRELGKGIFEPCNTCASCNEVSLGSSIDTIEIDAASNRGIDEIRELRDKIRFAPTSNKYKVYVIDECHMLTKEAFNALLKTLEEPPAHAVFIMATTEIHKIPPTILSRAQVFDFKKGKIAEIKKVLKEITKKEKIKIDDEAISLISRLSFGAFRDGISMLDQVASLRENEEEEITLEKAQQVLGQTTEAKVWEFLSYLIEQNRQKALNLIEELYFEGKDLENFIAEVVAVLRKMLFLKASVRAMELGEEEAAKLDELTEKVTSEKIVEITEKLLSVSGKVKSSVLGQLPLEMAVFELTKRLQTTKDIQIYETENTKDIRNYEKDVILSGSELSAADAASRTKLRDSVSPSSGYSPKVQNDNKNVGSEAILDRNALRARDDIGDIKKPSVASSRSSVSFSHDLWPEVFKEVKAHNNTLAALLRDAKIANATDDNIQLSVKFKFHADQICNKKNLPVIEKAILKLTGNVYRVECTVDPNLNVKKPADPDEELLNNALEVFEAEE